MICGKHIFSSRDEAAASMVGINKDKRPGRSQNRLSTTYFCPDCQGWHIASRCNKRVSKSKSKEFKDTNQTDYNRKMKEYQTLIIRNYSSKPI